MKFTKSSSFYSIPVWEFNLPAGHSRPGAVECPTKANRNTGRLEHGPRQRFRCYAAVSERFPAVRAVRWENYDALEQMSEEEMISALLTCLPHKATHVRIHGSGDFFCLDYFNAWLEVVRIRKSVWFWAFTKMPQYWVAASNRIPMNLCLQASYGGAHDRLIDQYKLKSARVFPSWAEAEASGLPIDTDDSLAMRGAQSFALVDNFNGGKDAKGR